MLSQKNNFATHRMLSRQNISIKNLDAVIITISHIDSVPRSGHGDTVRTIELRITRPCGTRRAHGGNIGAGGTIKDLDAVITSINHIDSVPRSGHGDTVRTIELRITRPF